MSRVSPIAPVAVIFSHMHIISLRCNVCGAPLQVPARANYITCGFCSAQLAVQRTESAITTETLEAVAAGTEKMAQDLETIKIQNELERLDREWTMGIEKYKVRGKDGHYSVPSTGSSVACGVIVIAFGIIWLTIAASIGAPGFVLLFGLLFVGVAIFNMVNGATKANAYAQARQAYETRRHELLHATRARPAPPGSS